MNFKKLLLIALSCLLCLSLVACNTGVGGEESESVSDTEPQDPYLPLYEGEVGVCVVYAPDADSDTLSIATKLANSLKRMGIATHETKPAVSVDDHDTVEVLVADTGYSESDEAYASLGYGEAKACVIGNKVVLVGYDISSLEKAVELFLYVINDCKDENGGLRIARDYTETAITNEKVAALPVMEGATLTSVSDTGDGCYMLTLECSDRNIFDGYLKVVTDEGFVLGAENSIDNNAFKTYTKGADALTVMYLANTKTAKVLIEPLENIDLAIMNENGAYTKGNVGVSLTQLGLTYASDTQTADYYTSGMSYVMRLDDGSFIVVDGGYDKQGDADRLYETMKMQSGSENVTVAAWIFTHAHSDHVEFFPKFAASYSEKVTIERFIYNRPGADLRNGHYDSHEKLIGAIDTYYRDVPMIKAHAGQKYYIRSVEIEMLYTLEISASKLTNYNNASLVFRINAEGKQIMITGDYSETSPMLLKLYTAEALKSDIMQVAHHGISDGNNTFNTTVAPEYALWPVVSLQLKTYWDKNPTNIDLTTYFFNNYFLNMDEGKVFVAGDDVVVMTLAGNITATAYDNFDEFIGGAAK